MAANDKRWIVKDSEGHLFGPYSTEKILYKISKGDFTGDEQIAAYPGGQWYSISRESQFYDKLLELFSGQSDTKASPDDSDDDESLTPPVVLAPNPTPSPPKKQISAGPSPGPKSVTAADQPQKAKRRTRRSQSSSQLGPVIELVKVKDLVKKEITKRAWIPLAVLLMVIAGAWALLTPGKHEEDRIHLVVPQTFGAVGPTVSSKQHLQKGLTNFLQDTFSGYQQAQNEFVQVLEEDGRNLEVISLLCITYHELWPFANQDSHDLQAITKVTQVATRQDPGGQNSKVCKTVQLIFRGGYEDAKSLVESVLDNFSESQGPPILFYYLKAILLERTQNYQTAIGYFNSAEKLWPDWLRPYVAEASTQSKNNAPMEAQKIYNQVLKANPQHTLSKVELGLIEARIFRHYKKAEELLESALSPGADRVPKSVESRGFFGLAEIALQNNDTGRALKYAKQAYASNSGNIEAKNLVVQLGGVQNLRKVKISSKQREFEGDQFVRENDHQSAQAHYKAAFDEDNKNAIAAMKAAKSLWNLSLSTEAIEWLNKAIKADYKLFEAYVLLADYYSQKFDFDGAARILATAQRTAPKSYEVFRGFALVELRRNNPQGAITYAKQALKLYDIDVESHIIMAKASMLLKDYRSAFASAAKAQEIDSNNHDAQVVYARALAGLQGVDLGIEYLRKLAATYPLVAAYQIALGELMLDDERYGAAEKVFEQIVQVDAKSKQGLLHLARVYRAQNKLEEALNALLRAAVLDPADPEPLFQAALIYLDVKKADAAQAQLQRVARINPNYPLVHYYLGRAALVANNPQGALDEALKERKVNPNLAEAYMLAADAYTEMKQYSLCAREYQTAIKLRPLGAMIYVRMARCYRLAGNLEIAKSMLNLATKEESGLPDIYKELGQVNEMKGDFSLAIEAYNQYFVLEPNAADKATIQNRIQSLLRGNSAN